MKRFLRFLIRLAKLTEGKGIRFRWRFLSPGIQNLEKFEINLLIVKNVAYLKIAEICILSFLYFHPNSIFYVHCDSETAAVAVKKFKKNGSKVIVLNDMSNEKSWQEAKLELFFKLSGTSQILMDADLRWNGVLPPLTGITFFVREFDMSEKSPERQVIRAINHGQLTKSQMKNTSFVFLNEKNLASAEKNEMLQTVRNFENLLNESDVGQLDKASLDRLREQFVISVFADRWSDEIFYLKSSDGHKDAKFVESSYFGATGSTF